MIEPRANSWLIDWHVTNELHQVALKFHSHNIIMLTISHIPVDILFEILEETSQSDLPALCRVNRSFRHHASDFLYRDISPLNILEVCATLTRSPDLAARVKRFEVSRPSIQPLMVDESKFALIGNALRCLPNLRSLTLSFAGQFSWILAGCTFRIETFICFLACDDQLVHFLNGQPELTTVKLSRPCKGLHIGPTCVPRLTKIEAQVSWLNELIPGRPVKEVIFHEDSRFTPVLDLSLLTSSLSHIRILSIGSPSLRGLHPMQVASYLPALEDLTITEPDITISLHEEVILLPV